MKTSIIKTVAIKFENGHILIGESFGNFFVKTSDGIFTYSEDEMEEIYNFQLCEIAMETLNQIDNGQ